MNEREVMQESAENVLVIDINLTRSLAFVLVIILLFGIVISYMAWGHQEAVAAAPEISTSSIGMRQYYLTKDLYSGQGALNACASGYHFASIWEILDTSNLQYDSVLGKYRTDDGFGPPSMLQGWVRTGWNAQATNYPGAANCNAWTSSSSSDYGTVVNLDYDWDSYRGTVGVWMVGTSACGGLGENYVWCVED
jgi:hypothetical protein